MKGPSVIRLVLLVAFLLVVIGPAVEVSEAAAQPALVPRGYLTSPQELARVKAQADKKIEPYASAVSSTIAYADKIIAMKRVYNVPATYTFNHSSTTFPDWMCDMNKIAYGLALAYRLTGKADYAAKAREYILNLQKCRNMNDTYQRQAMLNVSVHIPKFVFAADLLEGWTGWTAADKKQFQDWLCKVAYPVTRRGLAQSGGNWHAWAEGANMALADYCWDRPDLQFKSEDPNDPMVFTAAEAYAYGRQEFFNQANGHNGATSATGADNQVLGQADILKKSMIRPDGGVPDELRRAQPADSTVITEHQNASQNYMGYHRDGLAVTCEIAYHRGDPSLYDNICTTTDQHYVAETGAVVTLPAGRGSLREMLTFLLANQDKGGIVIDLNDGHKGSLEVLLRRYKDRVIPSFVDWRLENRQFVGGRFENKAWSKVYVDRLMTQLQKFRPITDAWVSFTTLTHADPLGVVGEPPIVTPPGGEIKVPAAPRGLSAAAHNGLVCLAWYAPPGATSYIVKRSTESKTGYKTIVSGLVGTKFTDTGLTAGTTYYYIVTSVRAGQEGPASMEVSGTPMSVPTPTALPATAPAPAPSPA